MSRLLVCGIATLDLIFDVAKIPAKAVKYVAEDASMHIGGCAANAAIAAARLGSEVHFAGRIGDDFFADLITTRLTEERIDCTRLRRIKSAKSPYSAVSVASDGERQIVNFRGSGLGQQADWIRNAEGFDAVLADTRWREGAVAAMRAAHQAGVHGILDAEPPALNDAMSLASHTAFSSLGLQEYTNQSNPLEALMHAGESIDGWICVTDGAHGVFSIENGQLQQTPAFSVNAVDTLGAGDVWHGAFAHALCNKHTETAAIQFANAAAALKCMKKGGGSAAPYADDVQKFLANFHSTTHTGNS